MIMQGKVKKDELDRETQSRIISFGASKIIKSQNGTISNENIDEILKRGEDRTIKELQ